MVALLLTAAIGTTIVVPFDGRVSFVTESGQPLDILPGDIVRGELLFEPVAGFDDGPWRKFDVPDGRMWLEVEDYRIDHAGWKYAVGFGTTVVTTGAGIIEPDGLDVAISSLNLADELQWGFFSVVDGPMVEYRLSEPVAVPEPSGLVLLLVSLVGFCSWRYLR